MIDSRCRFIRCGGDDPSIAEYSWKDYNDQDVKEICDGPFFFGASLAKSNLLISKVRTFALSGWAITTPSLFVI